METKTLPPIKYKKAYDKLIADKIINWMWETFFKECFKILASNTVYNDSDVIRNALEQGLLYYQDGAFYSATGRFRNELAKELENLGARYSKYRKAYLLDKSKVPMEILWAIDTVKANIGLKVGAIQAFLTNQLNNLPDEVKKLTFDTAVNQIMLDLQERVYKNAKEHKIELITPKLGQPQTSQQDNLEPLYVDDNKNKQTPESSKEDDKTDKSDDNKDALKDKDKDENKDSGKDKNKDKNKEDNLLSKLKPEKSLSNKLKVDKDTFKGKTKYDFINEEFAKNYTNNLDFWVKNWTPEHITKMRETVGQMAVNGKSQKAISDYLKKEFAISARKADFLARNETAIATSSYLSAKYRAEGFTHFKWHTNIDGRERPLHKELNGQIFPFNNPPIIDERTGQKGLPAQTYNCRCTFSPVVNKEFWQRRKQIYIENKKKHSFWEKIKDFFNGKN